MLRKSPVRTPALLAANRRNALKSTGPRTVRGRARVALNGLKHGRYAHHLGSRLLRAGDSKGAGLYREIWLSMLRVFVPGNFCTYCDCERMAAEVWCQMTRIQEGRGAKPESPLDSGCNPLWVGEAVSKSGAASNAAAPRRPSGRVDIRSWTLGAGVTFWIQRRRFWTMQRVLNFLLGEDAHADDCTLEPPAGAELEDAVRCHNYRPLRPSLEDRLRFGLDRHGNRYPELALPFLRKLRREGDWPLLERPAG